VSGQGAAAPIVDLARRADTWWYRRRHPDERHVVFDARTAMEYAMMAPVHRALAADPRLHVSLMSSESPGQLASIYRDATARHAVLSARDAWRAKVDAYVAADLLWATLPRGACRVQMFHGVAGKYSSKYDRPERSMREWHRLFFINRRRLRNFVAAGAVDEGSSAARLVGMPKVDCLVDGTLRRPDVLAAHGIDPGSRTVLYAPTWTPYSSLNALGEALVERLARAGNKVLLKQHENSPDMTHDRYAGIDWVGRLRPLLDRSGGRLIDDSDISPWMVGADVLISDHSSVGFEYLLLDRPLVRIEMPELLARTSIPPDYIALMVEASTSTRGVDDTVAAVDRAFADPRHGSTSRQAVVEELFYKPGTATARAVGELYDVLELEAPDAVKQWVPRPAFEGQPVPAARAGGTR
jgi:hypothetical protein